MGYYLGYKKSDEFHPIDLKINNAHDILSIVNFTCTFENEDELIEYLFDEGLIRDNDIELSYLIDKGKKGDKTYTSLPNIKRIFYRCNSNFFNIDNLKFYIEKNSEDKSLVIYLLSNLLKKYGIGVHIKNLLKNNVIEENRRTYLISILRTILTNSSIIRLNSSIQVLINLIQNNSNLIDLEIDSFIKTVLNNNDAVVFLYHMLYRHLKFPKVLEIEDLLNLEYAISSYHPKESEIRYIIDRFISHYILQGGRINSRNLVDLGSMIQDYKDYLFNLEIQQLNSITSEYGDYSEIDEFLEEDDFTRCDTTSEDVGIRLRQTDASIWKGN